MSISLNKSFRALLCMLFLSALLLGSANAQNSGDSLSVTGPSGHEYKTVQIGQQFWMEENLNTKRFTNGDPILEAQDHQQWQNSRTDSVPVWSHYENNPENGRYYGKLYNWHAVSDQRGICPVGWRVPNEQDWKLLMMHLGMTEEEFNSFGWRGKIAGKLISERTEPDPHPRWNAPNEIATNSSGFNAMPGGYRVGDPNYDEQQVNAFRMLGKEAVFWSAENQIARGFWSDREKVFKGGPKLTRGFAYSVRCIQN